MKVLFIVPQEKFNYKAPWTPLGAISIATFLKENGFEVSFIDRSFNKEKPEAFLMREQPDVVCVSVASTRVIDDAISISKTIRNHNLPIVWGGYYPTENYSDALKMGYTDYVALGEGERSVLNLLRALESGASLETVRGISFLQDGEVVVTQPQPPSDLKDFPVLDFTICDPQNYLHRYLFCEKMMYLYASKGCPSDCTFCPNPRFHCHTYRVRPVNYVIQEIRYLYDNYGLDGVYFSDECWYLKREVMREFCSRLREENLSIHWGCELRFGIFDDDDLQYMYDNGCRWIFFGVESGDPDMLKKVKKNIRVDQIRKTVAACNRIGIVAISSFIIGFPDETPQQLQRTIDLILEIQSGISVCNIFTPVPNSEIFEELIERNEYNPTYSIRNSKKTMAGEYSPYRCNTIPYKELRVIRSWFMWREFTKKSVVKESKHFEVALNAVKETINNIIRYGLKNFLPGVWLAAKEVVPIFWYAHFYPSIRKKYKLK